MKKYLLLLSAVLLGSIIFSPDYFKKDSAPVKTNPKIEMRKKIAKAFREQSSIDNRTIKANIKRSVIEKKEKDPQNKVMTSSLQKEIRKYVEEGKKDIGIVLKIRDEAEGFVITVMDVGGRVIRKRPGFLAVELPAERAEQIIMGSSSIGQARLPLKFYPAGMATEGVNLTGANIFNDTVFRGAGVKIAVVDVGFKGLSAAIAAGEIPADVKTRDFSGLGLQTEYYHGSACAEIIHDMAPEAELHLIKLGDEIAGYEMMDYCIDNNIDIINLSLGTFGSGPGDGTGYLDEAFDELREAGILVVASAGNYGDTTYSYQGATYTYGSHWEGVFYNTTGDIFHEFLKNDQDSFYNIIAAYPATNDDGAPETNEISIVMRWDDAWPGSSIDYDMYLFEIDDEGELVESAALIGSANYQEGSEFDEPLEWISMDIPDEEDYIHYYGLVIIRRDEQTPTRKKLEVYLGGTCEFIPFNGRLSAISTSSSSISEPADAASVIAVGAIDYAKWLTGPQEEYSSQGPTNDWNQNYARVKPDIMGPDAVTTYTYRTFKDSMPFRGTSAAAPHAAGMAALLLSSNPGIMPNELQVLLQANTIDMGVSRKDNLYGYGRLRIKDTDLDGMPDCWETKYGLNIYKNDALTDSDGDGLSNISEFRYGTNPREIDTDGDGMPDGWEVQYGLNPLVNDADGDLDNDGFTNLEEYQKGTLPNDRSSRPRKGMPWLPLLLE